MNTDIKAFKAYDHKKGMIDMRDIQNLVQMRPTEIHHKEDGSVDDKPCFAVLMEHPEFHPVIGQITLKMLNEALNKIGYQIRKM